MSIRIDPFRDLVGQVLVVRHGVVGSYHACQRLAFDAQPQYSGSLVHQMVAQALEVWPDRLRECVVVAPSAAGRLGAMVSEALGLDVTTISLKSRADGCEPATRQDEDRLQGSRCLLVDNCIETGATFVSAANTIWTHGGLVIGGIVLVEIKARTNGRKQHRLPLLFKVVSCTEQLIDYYTPDKCPACIIRASLGGES